MWIEAKVILKIAIVLGWPFPARYPVVCRYVYVHKFYGNAPAEGKIITLECVLGPGCMWLQYSKR